MMRVRIKKCFANGCIVLSAMLAPVISPAGAAAGAPAATVALANSGFVETGIASWYGGYFHGRRTASGEIFDTHQFTAAHPTLPMGSVVEITNLKNGRSTVARINDRGPYIPPRIVDCSHAVADALGFVNDGLADVRVRLLKSLRPRRVAAKTRMVATREDTAPALPAADVVVVEPEPKFCVQLGAFRDPTNAQVLVRRASILSLPVFVQAARAVQQVLVGPFNDADAAAAARRDLRLAGLAGFVRSYETVPAESTPGGSTAGQTSPLMKVNSASFSQ